MKRIIKWLYKLNFGIEYSYGNIIEREPKFNSVKPQGQITFDEWRREFSVGKSYDNHAKPWWKVNIDNFRDSIIEQSKQYC